MKSKKSSPKTKSSITMRTWVMFLIFLVVSFYCLAAIKRANETLASATDALNTYSTSLTTKLPTPTVKAKAPILKTNLKK